MKNTKSAMTCSELTAATVTTATLDKEWMAALDKRIKKRMETVFKKLNEENVASWKAYSDSINDDTYWNSEAIPKYRRGFNDLQWAQQQPRGKRPKIVLGDIVKCLANDGIGVVTKVTEAANGWPRQFAIDPIKGKKPEPPYHAWYYEGDIKLIKKSALRNFK